MERLFGKLGFSFLIVFLLAINVNAGGAVAGKVTILKGQVFIKRGSAKIPVKKDDTVLESDIVESEAGTARITMIDSNLVDVYPRSRVEIAKYVYKPNQDQKEVELKVDFGKIKSTVNQKYDGAKNKFQVKTPSAVAGVRGTVFTAEYDAVKKISKVVTIEGLVAVTKMIDRERQSPPVFVRPDQVVKVDVEQSKAEQPRDLKPEERESAQKQDKDLGYQYDPKKEKLPDQGSQQPPSSVDGGKGTVASGGGSDKDKTVTTGSGSPERPVLGGGIIAGDKEQGSDRGADRGSDRGQERKERRDDGNSGKEVVSRETAPVKEVAVKEIKEVKEVREPIKEISAAEPAKEIKEQVREQIKEIKDSVKSEPKENQEQARQQIKEIQQNVKDRIKEVREEKREQQQEARAKREQLQQQEQERRQKEAEQEQAKKQKQLEEEQAKKQKQLEEEQAKKQKQLEEEQARRQKQLEEEQQKKQIQLEEAQKKAEAARLAAEIAKRAETVIAPVTPPKTDTISVPNLLTPRK